MKYIINEGTQASREVVADDWVADDRFVHFRNGDAIVFAIKLEKVVTITAEDAETTTPPKKGIKVLS